MRNATRVIESVLDDLLPKKSIFTTMQQSTSSSSLAIVTTTEPCRLVYEVNDMGTPIHSEYRLATIQMRDSVIDWALLMNQLEPGRELSPNDQSQLDALSEKMRDLRKTIVGSKGPIDQEFMETLLSYLYYMGNLLPVMANTRLPFVYNVEGGNTASHSSLQFEYLMLMWLLTSRLYTHNEAILSQIEENDALFEKYMATLDFCIDMTTEMAKKCGSSFGAMSTGRLVFQHSPTSLSSSQPFYLPDHERSEELQQQQEYDCFTACFGHVKGIKARRHIFYAKKYEACLRVALRRLSLGALLEERPYDALCVENESDVADLANMTNQIERHYRQANNQMNHLESYGYAYTTYRAFYWQMNTALIKGALDLYGHNKDTMLGTLGKQALKRMEEARDAIDLFHAETKGFPYDETLKQTLKQLEQRVIQFHQRVYDQVTVSESRTAKDVTLLELEEAIVENAREETTDFSQKMQLLHASLCDDSLKRTIGALYRFKKNLLMQQDVGMGVSYDAVDNDTAMEYRDSQSYIKTCVSHERLLWVDYLLRNTTRDRLKRPVLILGEQMIERLTTERDAIREIIAYNNEHWFSQLSVDEASLSSISSKLIQSQIDL